MKTTRTTTTTRTTRTTTTNEYDDTDERSVRPRVGIRLAYRLMGRDRRRPE